MNRERDDMDWIEDFLDGSLNNEAEREFQSKLNSNPVFAEKYQQRLKLQQTWQESENHIVVRAKVENIIREEKSSIRYRQNILMIAASFVAVIGLASILLFVIPNKSTEEPQQANILADSIKKPDNSKGPQQIGIPKYGKSDTLPTKDINQIDLIIPADHAEFHNGDSIHFKWRTNLDKSELVIKEKSTDSLVLKMNFPEGVTEYLFEIQNLHIGSYTWFINYPGNSREFLIERHI